MEDRAWSKENRNIHWHRTVAKYGYSVQLLAYWVDEDIAFDHEKSLISYLKSTGLKLVNLTGGGEGSAGYRWTEEQKAAFDMTGEKNGMHGKRHSEETREKIRQKALGRKISDEAKRKISEKLKNRIFSDTHRAKLSQTSIGNKAGIGKSRNGKKCLVDGIEYATTRLASAVLGVSPGVIQSRCKNPKYPNFIYL